MAAKTPSTPTSSGTETRLYGLVRASSSITGGTHRVAVTAVVSELGVSEANLRHLLFARNGLPERLLLKLQELTGL